MHEFLAIGGEVDTNDCVIRGEKSDEFILELFNFDCAIIGSEYFSENEIGVRSKRDIPFKKIVISKSKLIILPADYTKHGKSGYEILNFKEILSEEPDKKFIVVIGNPANEKENKVPEKFKKFAEHNNGEMDISFIFV